MYPQYTYILTLEAGFAELLCWCGRRPYPKAWAGAGSWTEGQNGNITAGHVTENRAHQLTGGLPAAAVEEGTLALRITPLTVHTQPADRQTGKPDGTHLCTRQNPCHAAALPTTHWATYTSAFVKRCNPSRSSREIAVELALWHFQPGLSKSRAWSYEP